MMRDTPTAGHPMVIGHRGHPAGAPEQTLASYIAAATLGADMIEADVRLTHDGQLVMLHDETLDRTTNGHGRVVDHTFEQLRMLDAGGWYSAAFVGERVPALAEVFAVAEEYRVALCLEAKGMTPDETERVAILVAQEIQRRDRLERDFVASFDHDALAVAGRLVPGLRTAPDRLPERGHSATADLIAQARRAGAGVIQHHCADLTADVVDALHAVGLRVWAWPTNSPAEIDAALAAGVDAVMGDDVAALVRRRRELTRSSGLLPD